MELDVMPTFPTLIGRVRLPDAETMNQGLHALILNEEAQYPSLGRSNIRGWHSRPDFLHRSDANVDALTSWITWALRRMICATTGQDAFKGTLSITAWATVCRAGACRRGSCERTGRSVRRAFSSPATSRITCCVPQLAISLGSPLCRRNTPDRHFLQRKYKSACGGRSRHWRRKGRHSRNRYYSRIPGRRHGLGSNSGGPQPCECSVNPVSSQQHS